MKRLVIFFFLMISLVHYSFSQGEFIKRGRNGVGGSAGISMNKEINGSIYYAGFSYKGSLDLGLTYWRAYNEKVHDELFTPCITFYPIKQEDIRKKVPTIGISVGYNHYKSKSISFIDVPEPMLDRRVDTIKKELTVDAVKFGISAYRRIVYWEGSFFQPMIGADMSIKRSGCEFILRGGLAIGSRIKGWPLLILIPTVERQASTTKLFLTFCIVSYVYTR